MKIKHLNVHEHHHFFSVILGSVIGILGCAVLILYTALGSRASDINSIPKVDSYAVSSISNVANQENSKIVTGQGAWIGTGAVKTNAALGIYYPAVRIPATASITSAKLIFMAPSDQWIGINTTVSVENAASPLPFSNSALPAGRTVIGTAAYSNNIKWTANTRNANSTIDITNQIKLLQAIPSKSETSPVAIIIKSTGSAYSRKYFYNSPEGSSPQLVIQYNESTSTPVSPTMVAASPTMSMPMPTNTTAPAGTTAPSAPPVSGDFNDNALGSSYAMDLWKPIVKYDFCVDKTGKRIGATDAEAIAYVKKVHMQFYVIGPDGLRYPTWHPPVYTNAQTGEKCTFGHEHGRDPRGSYMWQTKQIQKYFNYDANKNGQMDTAEEARSGLPFGYVNQQMDTYYAAQGKNIMRHEDHLGHKVEYADGEADIATHQSTNLHTGGVWVGKLGNGVMAKDTGVRCHYLAKPHQGVSTPDAFVNNLHEVFYFADCTAPNSSMNQKISVAMMEAFGTPGGFTKFMPMCKIERRSDPQDFVNLGTDAMNSQYPKGLEGSDREIISRDCIEKGFLVPDGQWSGNLYEAWPAPLQLTDTSGNRLVWGINLLFDVEDANRYFYPEELKAQRGYNNPEAGKNMGFTMDLCYDKSLASQGRVYRGGPCSYATNYDQIKDIAWNDPRSAFKGVHRGMYFQPAVIENTGGVENWYTDPYGGNAQKTPFAGSVKQQVVGNNINYSKLINDSIDPRVNDRQHDDGNGTVHAPN